MQELSLEDKEELINKAKALLKAGTITVRRYQELRLGLDFSKRRGAVEQVKQNG